MANMRCTVKFFLDQVTCPGTLHLPDRNPVYLTIFLFGRLQKSPHVYPSFPMCFTTKIKFQRLFTNAKTPEQLLEILEDETILIELRQHVKGLKGGRVLAAFEETTRTFLFPSPSNIPKRNHLKRDILLTRTDNFPIGKGLDPQFTFRTKTYIEEGPFVHLTPENIPVNRQMPASEVSPKRGKQKTRSSPGRNVSINQSNDSIEMNDTLNNTQAGKHCICDCPTIEQEPAALDYWLENVGKKKLKTNEKKPFLTGKAPKQLLSKREFNDSYEKEKKFTGKGICDDCAVPLRTCVLCTAYKTVYGATSFLAHRFKKDKKTKKKRVKRRDRINSKTASPGKGKRCTQKYDAAKYNNSDEIENRGVEVNVLTADGNLKPIKRNQNKNYSVSKYSGDDDGDLDGLIRGSSTPLPPRSSTRASSVNPLLMEERSQSVPPKSLALRSKLFNPPVRRSISEEELESVRIHQRIKNLMKKNNSVLQYDLSSSESLTDDDLNVEDDLLSDCSLDDDSPTYTSPKKYVPAKSVVVPLTSEKKYSNRNIDGLTHRERLDARLKAIYADLYQKTLNNP